MPNYHFTISAGGPSSGNKQAIVAALTATHNEIAGAGVGGGNSDAIFCEVLPRPAAMPAGEPVDRPAIFLHEILGYQAMEAGELLLMPGKTSGPESL